MLSPSFPVPSSSAFTESSSFFFFLTYSLSPTSSASLLLIFFLQHLKISFLNFMNYSPLFSCLFISFTAIVLDCIIYSPYLCFSHFLLCPSQPTVVCLFPPFQWATMKPLSLRSLIASKLYILIKDKIFFLWGKKKSYFLCIKHRYLWNIKRCTEIFCDFNNFMEEGHEWMGLWKGLFRCNDESKVEADCKITDIFSFSYSLTSLCHLTCLLLHCSGNTLTDTLVTKNSAPLFFLIRL